MALSYHVGGLSSRGWKKEKEHQEKKEKIAKKVKKETKKEYYKRHWADLSKYENK